MTKHETTAKTRAKEIAGATGKTRRAAHRLVASGAPSWALLMGAADPAGGTAHDPTSHEVAIAARVLVALALGGRVEGRCVVVKEDDKEDDVRTVLAVVGRHKRLRPDDAFHDALRHGMDPSWDGVVFVLFGDGCVLEAQHLNRSQVAAYQGADLPRRYRLGFNEGSFALPGGGEYGVGIRQRIRPYLNYPSTV